MTLRKVLQTAVTQVAEETQKYILVGLAEISYYDEGTKEDYTRLHLFTDEEPYLELILKALRSIDLSSRNCISSVAYLFSDFPEIQEEIADMYFYLNISTLDKASFTGLPSDYPDIQKMQLFQAFPKRKKNV